MCTAVVGGSIHRAATRISAASDQRSTTPMTSHRIKDRRKPVRSGVLVCVFGIAVTFQNNSLAGLPLMDDLVLSNTECCVRWPGFRSCFGTAGTGGWLKYFWHSTGSSPGRVAKRVTASAWDALA